MWLQKLVHIPMYPFCLWIHTGSGTKLKEGDGLRDLFIVLSFLVTKVRKGISKPYFFPQLLLINPADQRIHRMWYIVLPALETQRWCKKKV